MLQHEVFRHQNEHFEHTINNEEISKEFFTYSYLYPTFGEAKHVSGIAAPDLCVFCEDLESNSRVVVIIMAYYSGFSSVVCGVKMVATVHVLFE